MKKLLLLSGLVFSLLIAVNTFAMAEDKISDTPPSVVTICIDGQPAELTTPSILINSTTYVSIRDFSMAMGADSVSWDNGTATVCAPGLNVTATVGNIYLVANERYLFVPNGCIMVGNTMMVPVRVMAKAFDASIEWDGQTHTVYLNKGSGAIIPGSIFYDKDDLYWLSRIINAEARGERLTGKIAVGAVIMNRVASPQFPDTVYKVIFDKQYGVQFTPAYSGAINNTPNEQCIIAAKIALDGGNTAGNSLYFTSTSNCWAAKTRPFAITIGNHSFYA